MSRVSSPAPPAAFARRPTSGWDSVPGTRWFRADLHLHTLDDHPGGRAKLPAGVTGSPDAPGTVRAYARAFLRAAVAAGLGVLGVTPHAVRCGGAPESSAVWQIVETWNTDDDDDGVPFRDKIFAVFPGFEPSFREGKDGLHLQILFDPEIGRDAFLRAFDLMMGGLDPYRGSTLQISSKTASAALAELRAFAERSGPQVRYAVLAPHADSGKGLFSALKAQVLELFDHEHVIALELGDNTLPEELRAKKGDWFTDGLARYRYALYHSSDAYKVTASADADFAIGHRFTWLKLASPTLEGLRQAFLAHESRLRIAYVRGEERALALRPDPPVPEGDGRPWLRRVEVRGGASFFSADGVATFDLSPDLTCVIGASMSGKSTLLDGVRVLLGASLPAEPKVREQVRARADERFLSGSPVVTLTWSGGAPPAEPPLFFAQTELQALASDPRALEDEVLTRLLPGASPRFEELRAKILTLDDDLSRRVARLAAVSESTARAAQELAEAEAAEARLALLESAGYAAWQVANRAVARLERLRSQVEEERARMTLVADATREWPSDLQSIDGGASGTGHELALALAEQARALLDDLHALALDVASRLQRARAEAERLRGELERAMAAAGSKERGDEALRQLRELGDRVRYVDSYRAEHTRLTEERQVARALYDDALAERQRCREAYREAMREVARVVLEDHSGRVLVEVREDAQLDALDRFVRGLKQAGVTQWWNGLGATRPSPAQLADALEQGSLERVGMSPAVAARFAEALPETQRLALRALPCRDENVLMMRTEDGSARPLSQLSGGQRVAMVLSLLLSADDRRPLFIDQPEDDLDARFMAESVLPALRRLKGRRQVVLATHDANLVVNGDAEQVLQLEATFDRGWVRVAGAIDDPDVKEAVLDTVDGGSEAFALRQRKYGY